MTTLAEIVRQHGAAYRQKFGDRLLPSHKRVLRDVVQCRTAAFGGHVYHCAACDETHYQYHSCQNRHCPQCQHNTAQQWLVRQQALLLPTPYFMVTFTLPAFLREVARRNQRIVYNLLFRSAAAALQELARDPRHVNGQVGLIGVLHTWGRNLSYHPHVHFLVPAGGVAIDGKQWLPTRHNFLVPIKPLSRLFRAKFQAGLRKAQLASPLTVDAWNTEWVVHCQPVGRGQTALRYLAPYIFRVAISNRRIIRAANGRVTFRYQATDTGKLRTCTLSAEEFLRRFLQHVLPKGFVKVRYYGLFSPAKRQQLAAIRSWLDATDLSTSSKNKASTKPQSSPTECCFRCPNCQQEMKLVRTFRPPPRRPP